MSYDVYCYRSLVGRLDAAEALEIFENSEEAETHEYISEAERKTMHDIAEALLAHDPGLVPDDADDVELEDAICLITSDDSSCVQISIYHDSVVLSVPFWYSGEKATIVLDNVADYTRIIRKTAGYFVYDPQTEEAFDPEINVHFSTDCFNAMAERMKYDEDDGSDRSSQRPWWKFW